MATDRGPPQERNPDPRIVVTPVDIDRSDEVTRWQYTCPRYHVRWRERDGYIHCWGCAERGFDPDYEYIRDRATGARLQIDEFRIVNEPDRELRPPRAPRRE